MTAPLHPLCRRCGWAMGGLGSWNGTACKCGHQSPPMQPLTPAELGLTPVRPNANVKPIDQKD